MESDFFRSLFSPALSIAKSTRLAALQTIP